MDNIDIALQQFQIRWNSHLASLGTAIPQLLTSQQFVDVTLACEGRKFNCHRLILASCSTYFAALLRDYPHKQPIIIMPSEVKTWHLNALIEFMYNGEVNVSQDGLQSLLKSARLLQINGLKNAEAVLNFNFVPSPTPQQQQPQTQMDTQLQPQPQQQQQQKPQLEPQQQQQQQQQQNLQNNNNSPSSSSSPLSYAQLSSTNHNNQMPSTSLQQSYLNGGNSSSSGIGGMNSGRRSPSGSVSSNDIANGISIPHNYVDDGILNPSYNNISDVLSVQQNDDINDRILIPQNHIINGGQQQNNYRNTSVLNIRKREHEHENKSSSSTTFDYSQPSTSNGPNCKISKNYCVNTLTNNANQFTNDNEIIQIKEEPIDVVNFHIDESTSDQEINVDQFQQCDDSSFTNNGQEYINESGDNTRENSNEMTASSENDGKRIKKKKPRKKIRRVRRSETEMQNASACVTNGATFSTASRLFDISISTIRFFMARKGILPKRKRGRAAANATPPCSSENKEEITIASSPINVIASKSGTTLPTSKSTATIISTSRGGVTSTTRAAAAASVSRRNIKNVKGNINVNNSIDNDGDGDDGDGLSSSSSSSSLNIDYQHNKINNTNSRSSSPSEPPFHFANYKLPSFNQKFS